MAQWVRLCAVAEAPKTGEVMEAEAAGRAVCLANLDGKLAAVDNVCPHRDAPLGQGRLEGGLVVCPWHSWTFDLRTGVSDYPGIERVAVFPLKIVGNEVLVDIA
jgi:nitrite reductase (NADH) small subunit